MSPETAQPLMTHNDPIAPVIFGVTLIVVTHELDSAFAIGERIALIDRGKILAIGTPEEVKASEDDIVRDFLDRQPEIALEHSERYRRWMTGQ